MNMNISFNVGLVTCSSSVYNHVGPVTSCNSLYNLLVMQCSVHTHVSVHFDDDNASL